MTVDFVVSAKGGDPYLPLLGNYFCCTGKTTWVHANAAVLALSLETEYPPEFRTVLGIMADNTVDCPEEGWPYLGPLYMDFDGQTLAEAIAGFQSLIGKVDAMGLDLESVRIFASGGRGFHIEIPMQCFMATIPPQGVMGLPYIYKEMASALYVETLDMRVFSARKGRMWRVPNRQRANGQFKVPLTVAEAMSITPDSYAALTCAPRPFSPLAQPELCNDLAELYGTAADKVAASAQRTKSNNRAVSEITWRFGGKLPPSLAALGKGRFPARGGFNKIALQMCLAAQAVGMDEGATLAACAGLIQDHESDGHRYDTPAKRRHELRSMFHYISGSNYAFSVGGARSILPIGLKCTDFRGL